jgi:EAL domain-containing protein (putative c-di-GMP-specific phosphodiesterase class I)
MKAKGQGTFPRLRNKLLVGLRGPQALAFLPAFALAAFWLGGEGMLVAAALGLPMLYIAVGGFSATGSPLSDGVVDETAVVSKTTAIALAGRALARAREAGLGTACILVEAEGVDAIAQHHGETEAEALRQLALTRLRNLLRRGDQVFRLTDDRFILLLAPSTRLDLETLLHLAARLQTSLEEPATIENATRFFSASVGFCGSARLRDQAKGDEFFDAASIALSEAVANGPSAIRAWSDGMQEAHTAQKGLLREVEKALQNGQIQPWFQPQVCTSTGQITGVEALARWIHPERGIIPPAQFLRSLEDSGHLGQLGETVLQHSLTALRTWDHAGLDVPRVSVNFSDPELRDPKLVEHIQWELDRFGLTAQRLGIEVLESVITSSPDGIVARNIARLAEFGCYIDLDDFGTGHASINALRRFKVHRLKIDRSFVTRVDRDEDQRRILAAVLGMADRLGIETLAEGVESVGEHALLAQLGCDHVQGFGIARPMPADQLIDWAKSYAAKIAGAAKLGRNAV